jgi:hypothetical protein
MRSTHQQMAVGNKLHVFQDRTGQRLTSKMAAKPDVTSISTFLSLQLSQCSPGFDNLTSCCRRPCCLPGLIATVLASQFLHPADNQVTVSQPSFPYAVMFPYLSIAS